MIRLHHYPGNASFTPHVLLHELGVPFELVLVDRTQRAHKSPDYLRLNPMGQIPVLEHDGLVLYEAAAICLHLVDRFPQAGLAPVPGSNERAHFYKWLVWMTNTLQVTLMHYFYPERLLDESDAGVPGLLRAQAEARVGPLLQLMDDQLAGHGGPWLLGDRYSAADPYAFMLGRWTRGFGSRPAREFPHLGPFLQRMLQRPAVQRAVAAEGLVPPLI